jgi:hypothetical protein
MRKGGRAARGLVEEMSLPRSGSRLPSLNVGQDNCAHRLGQQPQSVPKITLDGHETGRNHPGRTPLAIPADTTHAHNGQADRLCDAIARLLGVEGHFAGICAGSARGIARLGALRGRQNSKSHHNERTYTNPLRRDVQQIRRHREPDDEDEEADQVRRER